LTQASGDGIFAADLEINHKNSNDTPRIQKQELDYHPISGTIYPTSDMYFCGYLKTRYGLKVVDVIRDPQGRCKWLLDIGELNPDELYNNYANGDVAPIASYVAALRHLKSQVRNQ
jgi:hypothetical protein